MRLLLGAAAIAIVTQVLLFINEVQVFFLVEFRRIILTLVCDVEALQHVDEHRLLCFHISFVRVADEIHVDFTVPALALVVNDSMERIFLLELVEVFVADL